MFATLINVGLTESTGKTLIVSTQEITQATPQPTATPIAEVAEVSEWKTFEATAYIALCDTGCSGITKTGIDVRNTITYGGLRVIAVDPAYIALGSAVEVRLADGSTFEATAQDVGSAINGAEIDVLMADIDDAWDFGRQAVQIRIINEKGTDE